MAAAKYPLEIHPVDNGFIVRAGCMMLVFDDRAKLVVELVRWLENPEPVEKEYLTKFRSGGGVNVQEPMAGYNQATAGIIGAPGYGVDALLPRVR